MNRGITAAGVPQTAPELRGLAGHPRPRRQPWRRIATAAVVLAGLVAGLSPAAEPATAEAPAQVPGLAWQPCAEPTP